MPYIKVNKQKIADYKNTFDTVASRVNNIKTLFDSVAKSVDSDVRNLNNINSKINDISSRLANEKNVLTKASGFCANAYQSYFKENVPLPPSNYHNSFEGITSAYVVTLKNANVQSDEATKEEKSKNTIAKNVHKFVGNLGIVGGVVGKTGSLVSTLCQINSKGLNAENFVKLTKDGLGVGKNLVSTAKALATYKATTKPSVAKTQLKNRLLGLKKFDVFEGKYAKASSPTSAWVKNFKTAFKKNTDKLGLTTKAKKAGSKVVKNNANLGTKGVGKTKTASKVGNKVLAWAGVALSFAGNALENQQEYRDGKISKARAVYETIGETATDLVVDWAVGAAVAATCVAAIGSAPVLLVGAITAGITIGADLLCKKVFGKDLSECVVDGAAALGKVVVKGVKKVGSAVVEKVSDFGKNVAKLGKTVAKATKNVVSNAVKKASNVVKKATNTVVKSTKKVVSTAVKSVASTAKKVASTAKQATKAVSNTVKKATTAVKQTANKVGNAVSKAAKNIGSKITGLFKKKK